MSNHDSAGLGVPPAERGPIIAEPNPLRPLAFSRGQWTFVVLVIAYHLYVAVLAVLNDPIPPLMVPVAAMTATSLPLLIGFFMIRSSLTALPPQFFQEPGPSRAEIPAVLREHYLPKLIVALFPAAVCYALIVLSQFWSLGTGIFLFSEWRWWVLWAGSQGPVLLFLFASIRAIGVERGTFGGFVLQLLNIKWLLVFWAVFFMPVILAMPTSGRSRARLETTPYTERGDAFAAIVGGMDERLLFGMCTAFVLIAWILVWAAHRQLVRELAPP
jgi:hypothetical protein